MTELRNLAAGVGLALAAGLPVVYATRDWRAGQAGAAVLATASVALWLGMWLADALGARFALRRLGRHRTVDHHTYVHLVEDPAEAFWREVRRWRT